MNASKDQFIEHGSTLSCKVRMLAFMLAWTHTVVDVLNGVRDFGQFSLNSDDSQVRESGGSGISICKN